MPDLKYQEPRAKYFILQNQLQATFKEINKFGSLSKQCGKMVYTNLFVHQTCRVKTGLCIKQANQEQSIG